LFYFDYSFGVLLCAVIAAFTVGAMNPNEISTIDSFALGGIRKIAWGVGAGIVFNLANMLLVAAIAVAGLSVAFPIGIGLALVIGVVWNYFLNPQGHPALLFGGSALVIGAIIVDAIAYRAHARNIRQVLAANATAAPTAAQKSFGLRRPQAPKSAKAGPAKGIALSLISGVLMGSFYPLVEMGKSGDNGLPAYAIALVFAVGVFCSTFVFSIFFALLPVQGEPVQLSQYFGGTGKQHLLGLLGGIIWMVGTIANFAAASAPATVQVGPAVSYAIGQGATMISALWGLLVWREFAGANGRVRVLLTVMLLLFLVGLALVSMAPLYSRA
jgi:glucose uptake protein